MQKGGKSKRVHAKQRLCGIVSDGNHTWVYAISDWLQSALTKQIVVTIKTNPAECAGYVYEGNVFRKMGLSVV